MNPGTEEVILAVRSSAWRHDMPVTLIRWKNGSYALHCQTGDHHCKAIEKARPLLLERGLILGEPHTEGPTGWYYHVAEVAG